MLFRSLAEHLTLNQQVQGSIPWWPTKARTSGMRKKHRIPFLCLKSSLPSQICPYSQPSPLFPHGRENPGHAQPSHREIFFSESALTTGKGHLSERARRPSRPTFYQGAYMSQTDQFEFKTEIKQLLDIITHSLYTSHVLSHDRRPSGLADGESVQSRRLDKSLDPGT